MIHREPIEYLSWSSDLNSIDKKILSFIDSLSTKEYSNLVLIHLFIVHNYQVPTVYHKKYNLKHISKTVTSIEDFDFKTLLDFFNKEKSNLVKDSDVRKSIDMTLISMIKKFREPNGWGNLDFVKILKK